MKKSKWSTLLGMIAGAALLIGFAGCDSASGNEGNSGNTDYWTMETVFAKAQELGYEGTLEAFMESVKGKDGKDGVGIKDVYIEDGCLFVELTEGSFVNCGAVKGENGKNGVSVVGAKVNEKGVLILELSDGNAIECGEVKGTKGEDGKDGTDGANGENGKDGVGLSSAAINEKGELELTFTDGNKKNLGVVVGTKGEDGKDGTNGNNGKDGVGVQTVEINADGELVITLTNEKEINLGNVKGAKGESGKNGVSITGVSINAEGELVITLSEGNPVNLGSVKGEKGDKGDKGETGDSVSGAQINENGELVLTFESGKTVTAGSVKGENGVGISDVKFNTEGELIVVKTDGTQLNLGKIPACDHRYSEWTIGLAATCTSIGFKTRECSECGHVDYEFIAATGHSYGEWTDIVSTCTTRWQVRVCTVCGESQTASAAPNGHDYGEWTSNGDGTHSRTCEHDSAHVETKDCHGGTATCTEQATCADCGAKYGELAAHSFTEEKAEAKYLKTAATCTKKAVYYKSCVCGKASETDAFEHGELRDHDYKNHVCKNCGKKQGEDLAYVLNDDRNGYTVTGIGTCTDADLYIPEEYNGLPVTAIGEKAFYGNADLTSVVISSGVTSIGNSAFDGCGSLTNAYYGGDAEQWAEIDIGSSNDALSDDTIYYYSASDPFAGESATNGKYWHYANGAPAVWGKSEEGQESEYKSAFQNLIASKNYSAEQEMKVTKNAGSEPVTTTVVYNMLLTKNAVEQSYEEQDRCEKELWAKVGGVDYCFVFNTETNEWTKAESSSSTNVESCFSQLTYMWGVFLNAESVMTWNEEKQAWFAESFDGSAYDAPVFYNVTVKIGGGYVTYLSWEQRQGDSTRNVTCRFTAFGTTTVDLAKVGLSEGSTAAPTEGDWNTAFSAIKSAKNYTFEFERKKTDNTGSEPETTTYFYTMLMTKNAVEEWIGYPEQNGAKELWATVGGVDYYFLLDSGMTEWEKKESNMNVEDCFSQFTYTWGVFLNAESVVTWNEEKQAWFAESFDGSAYDAPVFYNVTAKINNGYVTYLSWEQRSGNSTQIMTVRFTAFGTTTVDLAKVGLSEGTASAPTEEDWNTAFSAIKSAKNYNWSQEHRVEYFQKDGVTRTLSVKATVAITENALWQVTEQSQTVDETVTAYNSSDMFTNESGVTYYYKYDYSSGTWTRNEDDETTPDSVFANLRSQYEVFEAAYSSMKWDSANGYFFAKEYTYTDGSYTGTLYNFIVKIENGYVTMISYDMSKEATDTEDGYKGTLTFTMADFGNVSVEIPEVADSSETEEAA